MSPSKLRTALLLLVLLAVAVAAVYSREHNGFDLRGSLVPVEEIHLGGPARDGIPAIDRPKFVSGRDADFLEPDDRVLGLARGGVANESAQAFDADGNQLPAIVGFWFAWFAFHPQTEVFTAVP